MWTVLVAVVVMLACNVLGGGVVLAWVAASEGSGMLDPDAMSAVARDLGSRPYALVASFAITTTANVALALSCAGLSPVPWRRRLRLTHVGGGWLDVLIACVGVLAISTVFEAGATLVLLADTDPGVLGTLSKAAQAAPVGAYLLLLFFGSLGAGAGEELFFRGYMQTRFSRRFGPVAAVLVTSTAFGLIHFDKIQSVYALAVGLFVGWIAERSHSIVLPIVAHSVNNFRSFVLARYATATDEPEPATAAVVVLLLIATAVLVACIVVLHKRLHPPAPQAESSSPAAT